VIFSTFASDSEILFSIFFSYFFVFGARNSFLRRFFSVHRPGVCFSARRLWRKHSRGARA